MAKKKLSREEQARIEVGNTDVSCSHAVVFSLAFLFLIVSVLLIHFLTEPGAFRFAVSGKELKADLKAFEDDLNESSPVRQFAQEPLQKFLLNILHTGNEKVIAEKDGWLFYPEDVNYLAEPGFMRRSVQKKRSLTGVEPDPMPAMIRFNDELKQRKIRLIVVPVPVKASLYSDKLGAGEPCLQNKDFPLFLKELQKNNIEYCDIFPLFEEMRKKGTAVFLKTDTHWTPEAMDAASRKIAGMIGSGKKALSFAQSYPVENTGDTARLLKIAVPKEKTVLTPCDVIPDAASGVLILGDSFVNIYSLGTMGWGVRSGFSEHLAAYLGYPVDVLARNDGGDYVSRQILASELGKGRDRLAGKKTVVWLFSARKLPAGDWKTIPLKLEKAADTGFYTVRGREVVTGTVLAVSSVPRPGTTAYGDHVMTILLGDISPQGKKLLIHAESMQNHKWLPTAHLRSGERVAFEVFPWTENASKNPLAGKNRSFLPDAELLMQEPCSGILISPEAVPDGTPVHSTVPEAKPQGR